MTKKRQFTVYLAIFKLSCLISGLVKQITIYLLVTCQPFVITLL